MSLFSEKASHGHLFQGTPYLWLHWALCVYLSMSCFHPGRELWVHFTTLAQLYFSAMPCFSWPATLSASCLVLISRSKSLDSKSYTVQLRFEISSSSPSFTLEVLSILQSPSPLIEKKVCVASLDRSLWRRSCTFLSILIMSCAHLPHLPSWCRLWYQILSYLLIQKSHSYYDGQQCG